MAERKESVARRDLVEFQKLTEQWQRECGVRSSVDEMVAFPSYQQIIGMGDRAVPLILSELSKQGADPGHWFWALRVITGENPVPESAQGSVQLMAKAWLAWGEREGYARQLAAA